MAPRMGVDTRSPEEPTLTYSTLVLSTLFWIDAGIWAMAVVFDWFLKRVSICKWDILVCYDVYR